MTNNQNKPEWEKSFDKDFPNEESGYLNSKKEHVNLFNPAVDARQIKSFISSLLKSQKEEIKRGIKERYQIMIKLYNGKFPFVVFEGKADEIEKIAIYRQAVSEILKNL